jgi:hypothetical protein
MKNATKRGGVLSAMFLSCPSNNPLPHFSMHNNETGKWLVVRQEHCNMEY